MSLKKQDLYNFITQKKREVLLEKSEPLFNEVREKKRSYAEKILREKGYYDIDKEKILEARKVVSDLRDACDYRSYKISEIYDHLNYLLDEERMTTYVHDHINFELNDEIFKLETKARQVRRAIEEEFEKIEQVVKSKSNAKQGYKFLKELGFDLSNLEIVEKMEIANININSDLLGLPEVEKEGFGSNEEV